MIINLVGYYFPIAMINTVIYIKWGFWGVLRYGGVAAGSTAWAVAVATGTAESSHFKPEMGNSQF